MKTLFKSVPAFFLFAASVSSCSTLSKTKSVDYDYLYISKQGIIQRPLVTDLEVAKEKQKISRTYTNITITQAKENIMGEFIQQFNCDLIVQPYFITNTEGTSVKTTVSLSVTGYPASYKNIRPFVLNDTANYLIGNHVNNNLNRPFTNNSTEVAPKKKKSSVGIVLGTIGGLAVLGILASVLGGGI